MEYEFLLRETPNPPPCPGRSWKSLEQDKFAKPLIVLLNETRRRAVLSGKGMFSLSNSCPFLHANVLQMSLTLSSGYLLVIQGQLVIRFFKFVGRISQAKSKLQNSCHWEFMNVLMVYASMFENDLFHPSSKHYVGMM